ncbi:phospho-N-acetylmuramoyl-pentapeptide-transferase [Candidatus Caldatribacterium sp.]|uniref:phospho-N-acetylmuramoyl-pentapeptide- transferase n=1 Tax=Candidatus Caldatribacterium sp. TaxID=2282143 RepID=UPI002999DE71|nr:phospho-N-acetylmuramoyl-pentapeptide-transferase [Candidatus Caldatribacterium sp.]MDW8080448.1 phospho-N-acetylmuramoyl-pentapeptide-transferase [Candidatus Calescibacterium sp.]
MLEVLQEGGLRALLAWIFGISLFPLFVRWQKARSLGQKIKKEGPPMHLHKENTPSMGGIIVILAAFMSTLLRPPIPDFRLLLVLLGFLFLGFLDDYWKSVLHRPWGWKARYRLGVEVLLALCAMWWGREAFPHTLAIPFTERVLFLSPKLFFLYGVFLLVAACNAFNITDGLDGLAGGCGILTLLFFGVLLGYRGQASWSFLSFAFVGAFLAFLWFNSWPAGIFLGDSGSLPVGALIGVLALVSGYSLFLPLAGIVFVVDTFSVILQVVSFRLFGKRLFLMSPLHHHFELRGTKEAQVTARFLLVQSLGVILALVGVGR